MDNEKKPMVTVVDIQFRPGQKVYYFDPAGKTYKAGDHVIMDTARGPEYGLCTAGNHEIPQKDVVSPLREVLRIANAQDEKIIVENREKEARAFSVCLDMIRQEGLDMQLVSVECAFDGSKMLFFFTADERAGKNIAGVMDTLADGLALKVRERPVDAAVHVNTAGTGGHAHQTKILSSFVRDFTGSGESGEYAGRSKHDIHGSARIAVGGAYTFDQLLCEFRVHIPFYTAGAEQVTTETAAA